MTDTSREAWLVFPPRTIRQRLFLSSLLIGLILVSVVAVITWQVNRLNDAVATLQQASAQVAVVVEVRQDSNELLAVVNRLLPVEDAAIFEEKVTAVLDSLNANYDTMNTLAAAGTDDPSFDSLLNGVSVSVDSIINISETMVRQASAGQWPSVQVRIGVLTRDTQQISNQVSRLVNLAQEREQAVGKQLAASRQTANFRLLLLILFSVSLVSFVFWQTMRSIIRPVEQLSQGVKRLAAGSFYERVAVINQDELGQLAIAFNDMAERLGAAREELEQRIADRTRALRTSTEVSRRLSTILDQNQLVLEVVEEVQQALNCYHAHIYVFDEARENLIMVGGTGEAGQAMLNKGHKITKGRGLVGRAATTNKTVLVPDVAQEAGWLPNPLLPDTQSEIAVPIAMGDRVLGVLDIQQDAVGGFTDEDVSLLQSVANQVAIALRNARLFTQAQKQADQEAIINRIGQNIQSATDIKSVLRIAARELGQALGAERASVQLHNPGSSIGTRANGGGSS